MINKKAVCIVIAVVMVLFTVPTAIYGADSTIEYRISADKIDVLCGDIVELEFSILSLCEVSFNALQYDIHFDNDAFELVSDSVKQIWHSTDLSETDFGSAESVYAFSKAVKLPSGETYIQTAAMMYKSTGSSTFCSFKLRAKCDLQDVKSYIYGINEKAFTHGSGGVSSAVSKSYVSADQDTVRLDISDIGTDVKIIAAEYSLSGQFIKYLDIYRENGVYSISGYSSDSDTGYLKVFVINSAFVPESMPVTVIL